ncbi:MAG: hypothetical protein QME47_02550 [Candidatus Thermoplasmatota archaeon]|nr:hypothetical protein [Candidatus Thermoplasmatota archaeon]
MASELSGLKVELIFTESDLLWLKRFGIKWMKVGLRMNECFSIFKRRIAALTNNRWVQTKLSEWHRREEFMYND